MKEVFVGGECNQRCVVCPYAGKREYIDVKDISFSSGDVLVHGGEVLGHPDAWTILERARKEARTLGIRTNATYLFDYRVVSRLAALVDYVEVFAPAHFDYAYTFITGRQNVFPVHEEGLLNLRRQGVPVRVIVPLTKFITDEPHAFIAWLNSAVEPEAVRVVVWVPRKDVIARMHRHPRASLMLDTFFPPLNRVELAADAFLDAYGDVVSFENIPVCLVRNADPSRFSFTHPSKHARQCVHCALSSVCPGVYEEYYDVRGYPGELAPREG